MFFGDLLDESETDDSKYDVLRILHFRHSNRVFRSVRVSRPIAGVVISHTRILYYWLSGVS